MGLELCLWLINRIKCLKNGNKAVIIKIYLKEDIAKNRWYFLASIIVLNSLIKFPRDFCIKFLREKLFLPGILYPVQPTAWCEGGIRILSDK